MNRKNFLPVFLLYLLVYFGIYWLKSAWGALVLFHTGLIIILLPDFKNIFVLSVAKVRKRVLFPVLFSGMVAGVGLLSFISNQVVVFQLQKQILSLGLKKELWLPFIFYFVIVNPFLEEAFWRFKLFNPSEYPVAGDLLFAGYHLIILSMFIDSTWMIAAFIILSLTGWFWRQISRYTQSLLPSIMAHMMADFSILLVVYHFAFNHV